MRGSENHMIWGNTIILMGLLELLCTSRPVIPLNKNLKLYGYCSCRNFTFLNLKAIRLSRKFTSNWVILPRWWISGLYSYLLHMKTISLICSKLWSINFWIMLKTSSEPTICKRNWKSCDFCNIPSSLKIMKGLSETRAIHILLLLQCSC